MNIKKIIRIFIIFLLGVILTVALIFGGQELFYRVNAPSEYMITTENEIQKKYRYECGAYSTAYVLRSLGEDVDSIVSAWRKAQNVTTILKNMSRSYNNRCKQ